MRITIELSVANDSDSHQWLDRILHKITDGWHLWDTTDHKDSSAFEKTTWISERGAKGNEILELFKKSIEREAWDSGLHNRWVSVTSLPLNEDELKPEAAAKLAEQPLCILVENQLNDGKFIRRILDEFDSDLSKLCSKSAIKFDSVGGVKQMPDLVLDKMRESSSRPRLIAIADSDRRSRSDQESSAARDLRQVCGEHGVSCWILAKRSAENYLPSGLLRQLNPNDQGHADRVDAWETLSDDQKDFYNMKGGFKRDKLPKDHDDRKYPLFQGVSDADYKVLFYGFEMRGTEKLHKCWEISDITIKDELRARSRGDLEKGITLIRKEV